MKTETPKQILLKNYSPPAFLIETVHLDIVLHPTETRVRSRMKMRRNPAFSGKAAPLVLDGEDIVLDSVAIDRRQLDRKEFAVTGSSLTIHKVPAEFTLEIATTCNPTANTQLSGLYRSKGIYCTQCEAEGFRRITYFLDRPDVLARYTVRLEADMQEAGVLLSNGNPVERGTLANGKRHYAIWKDPHPKPAYLFALVGGNLASFGSTFTTKSGRNVDLTIYVEPGKEKRCAWAMDSLKRSMKWDEERFGLEYDLDVFNIVAVSDFNMGAMENKGLNIFNDRLVLASPETATDQNYADIERVIAHEYFHNWTGNRITCRDWFQLCLKEGLTVYRDQEFSADMRSSTVQRIAEVRNLKARQFPEDAGPLAHPVRPDRYIEINNFYTATVYDKGAELVRMIATMIGEDAFRRGMDLYFERHDGEAATVEQFVQCFTDVTNRDLGDFMLWYGQAGTPELVCSFKHDPRTKTAELSIEQILPVTPGQPKKKPIPVPLRFGLIGADGQDLKFEQTAGPEIRDGVAILTKRSEKIRFAGIAARPVPSLLRNFSAPVNITLARTDADLAFQMGHDSDLFNRWQATQDYAGRLLVAAVESLRKGKRPDKPNAFVAALMRSITDTKLEPAYRAQLLSMPSEGDIARIIGHDVDPAAIHKASRWLLKTIGTAAADDLLDIYERHQSKGRYSPSADEAGRRALRNRAMAMLLYRGKTEDTLRVRAHFDSARNLTDESFALALLSLTSGPVAKEAFDRFQNRWKDDHIVIDQWFALQASAPHASSLATTKRLMKHPLFALTNPNKVRALLFAFAGANQVNFNRPDGAGYEFIAAQVKALDRINPQVAARLMGAFRSWRALEPVRRKAARKAIAALAKSKPLSRDVYEIASKIIE